MRRAIVLAVFVGAFSCVGQPSAVAQSVGRGDLGAGYSWLAVPEGGFALPAGWLVTGSWRAGGIVSLAAEVGGNYSPHEGWLSIGTVMVGMRLSPARAGIRGYGEVLAGALTASSGQRRTFLAVAPGGGIEVPAGTRSAVRLGASVPVVFSNGYVTALVRVHAALVVRLGASRAQN